MDTTSLAHVLAALVVAPLLPGVANRIKAWFAGRHGRPVFQLYYDLAKLLRKGTVYSETSSWVVRAGPVVGVAAPMVALLMAPAAGVPAMVSFAWDFVALAYVLGLGRFFTVLSALDTGSAFEGMGASREVQLAALAEPALVLLLGATARSAGFEASLSGIFGSIGLGAWSVHAPVFTLVAVGLFILFLAENSRVPFDDPNTHLELTMIHEAMVLDHGGVDFAFILYGAALKMWVLALLIVGILLPFRTGNPWLDLLLATGGVLTVGALTGVVESTMARLRLLRLPQLLVAATVSSILAIVLQSR